MSKMKVVRDEIAHKGKFLTKIERHFTDTKGKECVWEMAKRETCGGIAAIAAITSEKEVILILSFRVPFNDYVIEFPAGLADNNERLVDTARRELLEETGYAVDDISLALIGPFNTGMVGDELAMFIGTNARYVQPPNLEDAEEIKVVKIAIDQLENFIVESQMKLKIDVKIASMIPFLKKYL
ncbi:MAG: NUDIX hydrolase [Parcubacteria group bacterium]|nr:NUDIX hydrolase [Parcubacteria group bacterium]